jgi:AcrR family transcriptional regulator
VSSLSVRGIVAGIRGTFYRHLRADEQDSLPGLVEPLVDWVLCYGQPSEEALQAVAVAKEVASRRPAAEPGESPHAWERSLGDRETRRSLGQRERIIRAAATVGVEKGYEALSIPAISSAAGVSNQTFYDNFPGKREAFLAAFDALATEALTIAGAAATAAGGGPEALGAGLGALLDHVAADPLFARLAFFELPTAGPAALDRAERTLDNFGTSFDPVVEEEEPAEAARNTILKAVAGGVWAIIQHEIAHGRQDRLPGLAPELIEFALTPLGVAQEAAEARERAQRAR